MDIGHKLSTSNLAFNEPEPWLSEYWASSANFQVTVFVSGCLHMLGKKCVIFDKHNKSKLIYHCAVGFDCILRTAEFKLADTVTLSKGEGTLIEWLLNL